MGLNARKPVFELVNNNPSDQPAHPGSLISAFVIRFLESTCIISKLATREISIFKLVSVAEQVGLSMTWSEIAKTGFLTTGHIYG